MKCFSLQTLLLCVAAEACMRVGAEASCARTLGEISCISVVLHQAALQIAGPGRKHWFGASFALLRSYTTFTDSELIVLTLPQGSGLPMGQG